MGLEAVKEAHSQQNRLIDMPNLGEVFGEGFDIPERFKNAGKTWDPQAINRNSIQIMKFLRNDSGEFEVLEENDDFHGKQRQAILDEYDDFTNDLQYINSRIYNFFNGIQFDDFDIEREWDTVMSLYKSSADTPLDRSNENIRKIDSLLREISTNVMLRRQTESPGSGAGIDIKDMIAQALRK